MSNFLVISISTIHDLALLFISWKEAPRRRLFCERLIEDYYVKGDKSRLEVAKNPYDAYGIAYEAIVRDCSSLFSVSFDTPKGHTPQFLVDRSEFRDLFKQLPTKFKTVDSVSDPSKIPTFHFVSPESLKQYFDTENDVKRFIMEGRAAFTVPLAPEGYETQLDSEEGRYYFVKWDSVEPVEGLLG